MTTAVALLAELHSLGASVTVVGDKLRIEAPAGTVTPALQEALANHKAEVMVLLAGKNAYARQEPASPAGTARNEPTVADRIEAGWKPGEWLAYHDSGALLTAKYAGVHTDGRVNIWLADGAVRAIPADMVALDWCPDAAEIFEERLSIMLDAGVPEDVARPRAEQCTLEYLGRLRGGVNE